MSNTEKVVSLFQDGSPGHRVLALAVLLGRETYPDRVCISLNAAAMMRDLGLSKVQVGLVFSTSLWPMGFSKYRRAGGAITSGWACVNSDRHLVVEHYSFTAKTFKYATIDVQVRHLTSNPA